MKRDMDLIRLILLNLEGDQEVDLDDYTDQQINYHNALIYDAGLAEGTEPVYVEGGECLCHLMRLTWDGHEFLDAARDETLWTTAMEKIRSAGSSITFPVVHAMLVAMIKDKLGLP